MTFFGIEIVSSQNYDEAIVLVPQCNLRVFNVQPHTHIWWQVHFSAFLELQFLVRYSSLVWLFRVGLKVWNEFYISKREMHFNFLCQLKNENFLIIFSHPSYIYNYMVCGSWNEYGLLRSECLPIYKTIHGPFDGSTCLINQCLCYGNLLSCDKQWISIFLWQNTVICRR